MRFYLKLLWARAFKNIQSEVQKTTQEDEAAESWERNKEIAQYIKDKSKKAEFVGRDREAMKKKGGGLKKEATKTRRNNL